MSVCHKRVLFFKVIIILMISNKSNKIQNGGISSTLHLGETSLLRISFFLDIESQKKNISHNLRLSHRNTVNTASLSILLSYFVTNNALIIGFSNAN